MREWGRPVAPLQTGVVPDGASPRDFGVEQSDTAATMVTAMAAITQPWSDMASHPRFSLCDHTHLLVRTDALASTCELDLAGSTELRIRVHCCDHKCPVTHGSGGMLASSRVDPSTEVKDKNPSMNRAEEYAYR